MVDERLELELNGLRSNVMDLKQQFVDNAVPDIQPVEVDRRVARPLLLSARHPPYHQNINSRPQQWKSKISNYLGIRMCMTVSRVEGKNKYTVVIRCPLMTQKILHGRISSSWPSWPNLSISPHLRVQNIVSEESEVVEACRNGNVCLVEQLFSCGKAHPNDSTMANDRPLIDVSLTLSFLYQSYKS